MSLPVSVKGRVAVLAFGTHGDVLPVAVSSLSSADLHLYFSTIDLQLILCCWSVMAGDLSRFWQLNWPRASQILG